MLVAWSDWEGCDRNLKVLERKQRGRCVLWGATICGRMFATYKAVLVSCLSTLVMALVLQNGQIIIAGVS